MTQNASPQPQTDLTQLLLSVTDTGLDSDITQSVVTDNAQPVTDTTTTGDVLTATSSTGPYTWDEPSHGARWGYARYG